jgi:hypothetical protein
MVLLTSPETSGYGRAPCTCTRRAAAPRAGQGRHGRSARTCDVADVPAVNSALKVFVKMLNGGSEHPQEVTQTSIARCARISACDIHHATPFYDIGTNTLVSTTIVVSPYPGYPCLPPRRVHVRDWPPSQLRGGGNGGEGPSTTTPCGPLTLPCTVDWSGGDDSGISIAPTKLGEVRDLLSGALFLPLFEGVAEGRVRVPPQHGATGLRQGGRCPVAASESDFTSIPWWPRDIRARREILLHRRWTWRVAREPKCRALWRGASGCGVLGRRGHDHLGHQRRHNCVECASRVHERDHALALLHDVRDGVPQPVQHLL